MPSSANRLRAMITELKAAGLGNDEIARRAQIACSALYRFAQGDSRQLSECFDRIAALVEKVTGKSPPPEQ